VIAVVAIFALLVGIMVPNVGTLSGRALRAGADHIAAQLELARQRSITTGIPHRLLVDLDAPGYRLEWEVSDADLARARGEAVPEQPTLDLGGSAPIPLSPPQQAQRRFRPMVGQLGDFVLLDEPLVFGGVETAEGWIQRGEAYVSFARDGTTSWTQIHVDDDAGRRLVIEVLPLADAVRVADADG
jgi:hypothetical protein